MGVMEMSCPAGSQRVDFSGAGPFYVKMGKMSNLVVRRYKSSGQTVNFPGVF